MVSQNVIPSKSFFGGARPFVFTEQGIAMLSGILNSDRAVQVNIAIMRTFIYMRRLMLTYKDLADSKRIQSICNRFQICQNRYKRSVTAQS